MMNQQLASTGNYLYQRTPIQSQQPIVAGGTIQFVITAGTYSLETAEIQFPITYPTNGTAAVGDSSYGIGDQRYLECVDQIIIYWDGALVENTQQPALIQKKKYDQLTNYNYTKIYGNKLQCPQYIDKITVAADPFPVTGKQPTSERYISYPLSLFCNCFYNGQQTFNVNITMQIQIRFKATLTVPMQSVLTGAQFPSATLSLTNPFIQLNKLQNIILPDTVRQCYQQMVYAQSSVTNSIEIPIQSKSDYQVIGKMLITRFNPTDQTALISGDNCSSTEPDGIKTTGVPGNVPGYTSLASIDGVQIIQASSAGDASQQWKFLGKNAKIDHLTSCAMYHNILGQGTHTFNITQSTGFDATYENMVFGYQYYI